jgi:hypothetical protein
MAKYNGSTELISGLIQANNQNFPLVDASAVQVDDNGKRLDKALEQINEMLNSGTTGGGAECGCNIYVQSDEPQDAPDGSIWIDTDEEHQSAGATNIDIDENELNAMLAEVLQ